MENSEQPPGGASPSASLWRDMRITRRALGCFPCGVLLSKKEKEYIYNEKKAPCRSFLQVCGITAAAAAMTASA